MITPHGERGRIAMPRRYLNGKFIQDCVPAGQHNRITGDAPAAGEKPSEWHSPREHLQRNTITPPATMLYCEYAPSEDRAYAEYTASLFW